MWEVCQPGVGVMIAMHWLCFKLLLRVSVTVCKHVL